MKNTRTTKMLLAAVAILGLSLTAGAASAATTVISGTNCRPLLGSVNLIDYTPFGVHSVNTTFGTTATVTCPIQLPASTFVQNISVKAFDRASGTVIGSGFSCTLFYQDGSGTTFTGPTAGTNNFSSASITGFTLNTSLFVTGATMQCAIPNMSGGQLSHIVNYTVTYT
jgi:hypothetical protein